ncbi:MAG: response regulator transcription factor [Anaerolineales bacterium]|jgi:DNA-binding NarL/FixJ family response regulator
MENGDIRVLVAEGEAYYREFLQLTLERAGFHVVGGAGDSIELLELARNYQPDVILLDISMMPNGDSSLLTRLGSGQLACKVILLSGSSNPERAAHAIRLGASGWASRRADPREITRSIRKVVNGSTVIPSWTNLEALEELGEQNPSGTSTEYGSGLTHQEKRVLQLVADGKSTCDIADFLAVSRNTVKTHLRNIYCKLGVTGRTQAAVWALRNGWAS